MGVNKQAIESRWVLADNFSQEIANELRARVLDGLATGNRRLYRSRYANVVRAKTAEGALRPFGLVVRRPRDHNLPLRLDAVFDGQRLDHPDIALDAVAPYSLPGSAIIWRHDSLGGSEVSGLGTVILSVTDGARCAHIAMPLNYSAAEATAEATAEAPIESRAQVVPLRPSKVPHPYELWASAFRTAAVALLAPLVDPLLADRRALELAIGFATTWDNASADASAGLQLIETALLLASCAPLSS